MSMPKIDFLNLPVAAKGKIQDVKKVAEIIKSRNN